MNGPLQLAAVTHKMKIFQETWRTCFFFLFLHQFPLNVLCSRCVLFSSLHCWAYVFFLVSYFIFLETALDQIWTCFDLLGKIPGELSFYLMNLAVFKIAVSSEFIFEAHRKKEKVGQQMGKEKMIVSKLCLHASRCVLNWEYWEYSLWREIHPGSEFEKVSRNQPALGLEDQKFIWVRDLNGSSHYRYGR